MAVGWGWGWLRMEKSPGDSRSIWAENRGIWAMWDENYPGQQLIMILSPRVSGGGGHEFPALCKFPVYHRSTDFWLICGSMDVCCINRPRTAQTIFTFTVRPLLFGFYFLVDIFHGRQGRGGEGEDCETLN